MSELILDIQYLLAEGKTPAEVARELEIPVRTVLEYLASAADCGADATDRS
jgi:DNA-binding CsgD family transcriptional regulator